MGIAIAVLATYLRLSSYAALYIRDILEYYRTDIKVETVSDSYYSPNLDPNVPLF